MDAVTSLPFNENAALAESNGATFAATDGAAPARKVVETSVVAHLPTYNACGPGLAENHTVVASRAAPAPNTALASDRLLNSCALPEPPAAIAGSRVTSNPRPKSTLGTPPVEIWVRYLQKWKRQVPCVPSGFMGVPR